jgi:tetratricopeptide (TPR) repeat protein
MGIDSLLSDLMVKAYTHQKQGELSLAIQSWNALANHQSSDHELRANAHLNLGDLHLQEGNNDLAYESMVKAISANPNSAEAFYCLAYMEQEKENFVGAIKFFELALKLNSNDAGAFNNLANCYDRLNKTNEAIKNYTQAISIDSKYIAAYYNRGNAYSKIAEDKLALKDLTKAIELDKKFYQAYYNRGSAYNRLGESRLAKKDLEKAKVLAQAEIEETTKQ